MTMSVPGDPQQCSAMTAKSGGEKRCVAWAITGGTVCVYHGGAAPQVRAKAAERLQELAGVAVQVQAQLLRDESVPPQVRARVAADVVRAAGLEAPQEQRIEVTNPDLDAAISEALSRRTGHTSPHTPAA